MSAGRTAAFLVVVVHLWAPLRGERSVSCLLRSACVLPCPFDPGPDVVIHWLKPPDDTSSVHSFYHDTDQLARQRQRFRGRTALFKDQISKGNASLSLTGVELEDRGRYKCYTSTIKGNNEDFVNVQVQAPVRDVLLEDDGQRLKCVSKDIFPKPSVSWSPPSDHSPSVTPSESGLFSVLSSVPLTQRPPLEYSCNVSTEHSWRSATYRRNREITSSGSRTDLSCTEAKDSIKSLVWTFNGTQTILKRTGSNSDYDPSWESKVESVSGSGLVLKDLSPDQQGLYSCVLTTDTGTYLTVTEVTVGEGSIQDSSTLGIAFGVSAGVLLLILIVFGIVCFAKRNRGNGVL